MLYTVINTFMPNQVKLLVLVRSGIGTNRGKLLDGQIYRNLRIEY